MRKLVFLFVFVFLGCATTPNDRLESTPRHNEWVEVPWQGRPTQTYVAYPQVSTKAPVVILIHENRGLTEWERGVADRLAEHGFIAVVPDMLFGLAPAGGGSRDFPSTDAARAAIGSLPRDATMGKLHAVADYAKSLPAGDGTISVAGFCWGGAQTWFFANQRYDLRAAYVFYGTGPQEPLAIERITAPVYGFYGGNDARVNATIPKTEELMKAAGKTFDYVVYEGAGHAFMRAGEQPDASEANKKAHDQAWERWLKLLSR